MPKAWLSICSRMSQIFRKTTYYHINHWERDYTQINTSMCIVTAGTFLLLLGFCKYAVMKKLWPQLGLLSFKSLINEILLNMYYKISIVP